MVFSRQSVLGQGCTLVTFSLLWLLSSYWVQGAHLCGREPNPRQTLPTENGLCRGGDSPTRRPTRKQGGGETFPATDPKRRGKAASCLGISGRQKAWGFCVGIFNLLTLSMSSLSWPTAVGSRRLESGQRKMSLLLILPAATAVPWPTWGNAGLWERDLKKQVTMRKETTVL